MKYNFDEIIDRHGTDSVKWDAVSERWGRNDLLPMWVADMDFRRSEEHTSELQSPDNISYAVFCLKKIFF